MRICSKFQSVISRACTKQLFIRLGLEFTQISRPFFLQRVCFRNFDAVYYKNILSQGNPRSLLHVYYPDPFRRSFATYLEQLSQEVLSILTGPTNLFNFLIGKLTHASLDDDIGLVMSFGAI